VSTTETPRASVVEVTDDELNVLLVDGRTIGVPLSWFPRLSKATANQRQKFRLIGGGVGIHWPEIDEDLSIAGLLLGTPALEQRIVSKKLK
jgi:Protein of unknown function (DUF2442)